MIGNSVSETMAINERTNESSIHSLASHTVAAQKSLPPSPPPLILSILHPSSFVAHF